MSEIYFSVDIETDGPIPGQNSMLSLGAVALDIDGNELSTYTVNFEPLRGATPDEDTMKWWAKQPAAVVEAARANPQEPWFAIQSFSDWVLTIAKDHGNAKPVFVGYPAGFDFLFVYWYLVKFTGGSPFSFSALDIKTFGMAVLGEGYRDVTKKTLKPFKPKDLKHTHVALDDAREQGQLFINLLRANRHGRAMHHLQNLLARIHRDGGHYTERHGLEKSVADADAIVARLLAEAAEP